MPDGLRLALTTLTVLPVRGPAALDRSTAGRAMACAPLAGLVVALPAAAVLAGLDAATRGDLLPAAAALAVLAALTRGLHLDGLADLADGLGSYAGPERARAVMKAPDVGALGLATVVLVLLVQAGALASCVAAGRGPLAVVVAAVAGRCAVTLACTPATPAATPSGLGALVAGTVAPGAAAAVAAGVLLVAGLLGLGVGAPVQAVAGVVVALVVARLLLRHAVRRLGGVTGDVLGALVEVATTVSLVALALAPA